MCFIYYLLNFFFWTDQTAGRDRRSHWLGANCPCVTPEALCNITQAVPGRLSFLGDTCLVYKAHNTPTGYVLHASTCVDVNRQQEKLVHLCRLFACCQLYSIVLVALPDTFSVFCLSIVHSFCNSVSMCFVQSLGRPSDLRTIQVLITSPISMPVWFKQLSKELLILLWCSWCLLGCSLMPLGCFWVFSMHASVLEVVLWHAWSQFSSRIPMERERERDR